MTMPAMLQRGLTRGLARGALLAGAATLFLAACGSSSKSPIAAPTTSASFVASHSKVAQIASTVPANGDLNPYGLVVVPTSVGDLVAGDTLVSNFNNQANVQGTGTTIVQVSPTGAVSTFAALTTLPAMDACPGGIGLTTALGILPGGWVVVGSLPTGAGGSLLSLDPAGCLIVLNSHGAVAETWSSPNINGPWDLAVEATSSGDAIFVSNVYTRISASASTQSGPCTVVRLDVTLPNGAAPQLTSTTVIGSGFIWMANKAALIQGDTGVTLSSDGTLYVVDAVTNAITSIPNALTRTDAVVAGQDTLSSGGSLNGPLGSTLAPNGDLLVANGNDGKVVEITPAGKQVDTVTLVPNGAGDLFGLTVSPDGSQLLFVNDGTNALDKATSS